METNNTNKRAREKYSQSPEHKKMKDTIEDPIENPINDMVTYAKGQESLGIELETEALSKLCSEAVNEDVRKLIECYRKSCDGIIEEMKDEMMKLGELGGDKVNILKEAIMFVVNDGIEIEETGIEELTDILIASIRNRMAKFCDDCQVWYIVGRENKLKKLCNICRAGMHDCIDEPKDGIRKGNMWFCSECHEQFTRQIKPQMMKKYRNVIFGGFKQSDESKKSSTIINKMIKEIRGVREEEAVEVIDMVAEEEPSKTNIENETKKQDVIIKNHVVKADNNKTNNENRNCQFWMTKKCKFGHQCKYEHPTRCKELMENGTCNDRHCKMVHPKICRNMLNDGYCSRKNCWFNHPTKIKNNYVSGKDNNRGHNFDQNQNGRVGRHDSRDIQRKQSYGYQLNHQINHMNGYHNTNSEGFLGKGPTPYEAYRDPNRPMKIMLGQLFEEMTTRIMNW